LIEPKPHGFADYDPAQIDARLGGNDAVTGLGDPCEAPPYEIEMLISYRLVRRW
jgi:hypothetical protein